MYALSIWIGALEISVKEGFIHIDARLDERFVHMDAQLDEEFE